MKGFQMMEPVCWAGHYGEWGLSVHGRGVICRTKDKHVAITRSYCGALRRRMVLIALTNI